MYLKHITPLLGGLLVIISISSCKKDDLTKKLNSSAMLKSDVSINGDILNSLCFHPLQVDLFKNCPEDITPVCACNTITFGNACTAEAYGFSNYETGACPQQDCQSEEIKRALSIITCPTDMNYTVCGCDNKNYASECFARKNGVLVFTPGPCENKPDTNPDSLLSNLCFDKNRVNPLTPCPAYIAPVCACEVFQFNNACEAEAYGFYIYEHGSCLQQQCINEEVKEALKNTLCEAEPNHVCGCDGNTYVNACDARRNGVMYYTNGTCQ